MLSDREKWKASNWDGLFESAFRNYLTANRGWNPQLNDQDIFNAVLASDKELKKMLYILPCEWNVQFHARLNTLIACLKTAFLNSSDLKLNEVPLNCDESRKKHVFACPKRAKVVHFMAQSYTIASEIFGYYTSFWHSFNQLSWNTVF